VAYDEMLAQRVRDCLADEPGVREIRMFGGLCFTLNGNMCVGVIGEELMIRVGPDAYERSLALPHARPMDFTGQPLRGMVYVAAAGVRQARGLRGWVERGAGFARGLKPKAGGARRRRKTVAAKAKLRTLR
jgi:TfoX/Sxy family transcriptional regulator of competence genes